MPSGLPALQGTQPRGSGTPPGSRPTSAEAQAQAITARPHTPSLDASTHTAPGLGRSPSRPSSASAAAAAAAIRGSGSAAPAHAPVSSLNSERLQGGMEGLSSSLRGVLSEQTLRNVEALKAIRQAADFVLPSQAGPSSPTQRAAGVAGPSHLSLSGALHQAATPHSTLTTTTPTAQPTAAAAAAAVSPAVAHTATGLTAPHILAPHLHGHTMAPPSAVAAGAGTVSGGAARGGASRPSSASGLPSRPQSPAGPPSPAPTHPAHPAPANTTTATPTIPPASLSRLALGPRWGATEGGRDSLGWVRGLARHGARSPLGQSGGEEGGVLEGVGGAETGTHRRGPLPSLRSDRREDVVLLAQWLEDMVGQLSSHDAQRVAGLLSATPAPGPPPNALLPSADPQQQPSSSTTAAHAPAAPTPAQLSGRESHEQQQQQQLTFTPARGPTSALELADGVLHVYDVAMEELKMQVSNECRERGVLMGVLWSQVKAVLELRAGLEAESRLGAMQAEYTRLMAARDTLSEDMASLEAHLAEADKEAQASALQEARTKRSLAGKLAEAQARAEEISSHWRVSDLALNNEVARRLAVGEELNRMRMLLAKTEHEWLAYRAEVEELRAGRQQVLESLEAARRDASAACAARDKARAELASVAEFRASQDVDLMRMRHEYETDEILVVSLRQQVRDLETQLAQLKSYQREQATKLGAVVADKEALQIERTHLMGGLAGVQARSNTLESNLNDVESQLAEVKSALTIKTSEHHLLQIESKEAAEKARKQIALLEHDVRSLTDRLTDTQYRLNGREISLRECEGELNVVREMLASVCRAMESQGAEGVPKPDEKGWTVMGPLGAVQRSIVTINRQLHTLWERMEALRRENSVLDERLETEIQMQKKTQAELYESRKQEAELLRAREVAEMQLDLNNQSKRSMEAETGRLQQDLTQAWSQAGQLREAEAKLSAEVERLKPFEPRTHELEFKVEDLERLLHVSTQSLEAAKQDIDVMKQQQDFYKSELEKNLAQIEELQAQIKQANIALVENDDLRVNRDNMDKKMDSLRAQLEASLRAHEATLHQLETAKFFLQGLDLTNPASEARVQSARMRHTPGMSTSRPSSASGGTGGAATRGAGPSSLWRPVTAPAHLMRSQSSRSRLASPVQRGENVQYLDVSGLDTVDEASPGKPRRNEADLPPAVLAMMRGPSAPITPPTFETTQALRAPSPQPSMPTLAPSRPVSAVSTTSVDSTASSLYGDDIPPEIVTLLEQRRVADKLQAKNAKWTKLKLQVMIAYNSKLRAALLSETEAKSAIEVQLIQQEVMHSQEMVDREKFLSEQLLGSLRGHISRVQHATSAELREMRLQLAGVREDLARLAATSMAMGVGLQDLQARLTARSDAGTQTAQALSPEWANFIQSFPEEDPVQPMSEGAICEAIVRIYVRALSTVSSIPVWGDHERTDTIYDAIMDHYTSRRAPGAFLLQYLQDMEGPIARLMRSVRRHCGNTRIGTFAYLTGMSPDGITWPPATWHFLLHVLHCLRLLLAGTWQSTVKAWGSSQATMGAGSGTTSKALVPVQAVYDLVGNLFNVQVPTDLEGSIARRLASIVVPSTTGLGVDLDALLLLLLTEYNAGNCPRSALLFPRRLTDGALFNLFNLGGHSDYKDALADGRAASVLRAITSPPKKPGTASVEFTDGGFWIRGESKRRDPKTPSVFI